MKKTNKTVAANTNNNIMEEVMKKAEVKVEVKEAVVEEPKKEKRAYRTFKEIILQRIDQRAKGLTEDQITPIKEKIANALDELQAVIDTNRGNIRAEKNIHRRLGKFTKEQILEYLTTLTTEEK